MSLIGKNIRKIRTVKKISQADFAEMFGLARPSVGAYEEGRAEPKTDTIIKIANYFGLSVDVLLTKELTVNELYKFDIFNKEFKESQPATVRKTDTDESQEDTPLVNKEIYLEYIVNYLNKDFINKLPCIRLPHTRHKKSRAFEVQDNAMEFNGQGLHAGDILSCSPVSVGEAKTLEIGDVCVAVTPTDIYVRRLATKRKTWEFKADNAVANPLEIQPKDLLELWKVEGYFSTLLKPPVMLEERVAVLESQMKELLERMK